MKKIMKRFMLVPVFLALAIIAYGQPAIVFLVNDVAVGEKAILTINDKLSVRIDNKTRVKYEFSKIVFGVIRQGIYEKVAQRTGNTVYDTITGSGRTEDFKERPEVVFDFGKLNISNPKQLIVVIQEIREINSKGEIILSRNFTLGKEYYFWFYQ